MPAYNCISGPLSPQRNLVQSWLTPSSTRKKKIFFMIIERILLNTMLSLQHVDQTSGIVPLYYFNFFSDFINI